MKARLIQLLARYIAVGLMAAAAYLFGDVSDDTAATIHQNAEALAAALGAVVMLGVDLFVHRIERGGIIKDK